MNKSGFEARIVRPVGKPCTNCYNWQAKERVEISRNYYNVVFR